MDKISYIDAFGIIGSLTDVKIDLLRTQPVLDATGKIVEDSRILEQRIVMSLPLAKDLAKKLSDAVADYEKNVGPVVDLGEVQEKIKQGANHG